MKKIAFVFCMALVWATVATSCKPHEDRVIDRINSLSEKVKNNAERWDADQWADALDELEDIHYDMEDCEFTKDQLRELGRVEGRLHMIIVTEGAKAMGDALVSFMDGAGAFMKGYQEGAASAYDPQEWKDLGEHVTGEMNRIVDEFLEDD